MPQINDNLLRLLGIVFLVLVLGSVGRFIATRKSAHELRVKRMGSLKVWWTLTFLMSVAVLFGSYGTAVLLAIASTLGLKEFVGLVDVRRIGRPALIAAFLMIPVQYTLIVNFQINVAKYFLPVVCLALFAVARLLSAGTEQYLRVTAGLFFAVILLVYNLSHAVLLFTLPVTKKPTVGVAGWFLFLVILTEMDDIAQALIGRRIGRRKITPRISPNKTWEGFLGGMFTSVVLAFLLAPWLTTFPTAASLDGGLITTAAGLVIFLAAFFGDINMSAVKRDAGVKDGSNILPGMGGIIDRIDSLTFTAPAFYYFVLFVNSGAS